MSADRTMPPRPHVQEAPRWVGEGESRIDVAGWALEPICIRALDTALKTHETVRMLKAGIALEFESLKLALGIGVPPRVAGTYRDPEASSHDFSVDLARADAILRARVRDQADPLGPAEAERIAKEVYQAARRDSDASQLRALKSTGWKWAERALWMLAVAIVAYFARRLGAHP